MIKIAPNEAVPAQSLTLTSSQSGPAWIIPVSEPGLDKFQITLNPMENGTWQGVFALHYPGTYRAEVGSEHIDFSVVELDNLGMLGEFSLTMGLVGIFFLGVVLWTKKRLA